MDEPTAMTRALDLAWRGWGRVHPNPLVGAVVLQDEAVVGEGWHAEYGDRHAEAVALEAAGERARGATLVVTLEPCAHQGKQPPCADAVVRAGVRRVVAALSDPNPLARGGAERLRAAGVEVEIGLLAEAAAAQNAGFLHQLQEPSRPFVALKLATSIDGRIADRSGRARWISGPEAREYVHWLRAGFDAIGVGGHTARVDDPALTARGSVQPRVPPRRVVFDRAGNLPDDLTVIRTASETPTIVITTTTLPPSGSHGGAGVSPAKAAGTAAPPSGAAPITDASGVTVVPAADLVAGLRSLRELGIGTLLVEGGGRLAGALLAAGLVDRYYWIQSPVWLGDDAVPAIAGLPGRPLETAARWRVVERRALGQDTLLVMDCA